MGWDGWGRLPPGRAVLGKLGDGWGPVRGEGIAKGLCVSDFSSGYRDQAPEVKWLFFIGKCEKGAK